MVGREPIVGEELVGIEARLLEEGGNRGEGPDTDDSGAVQRWVHLTFAPRFAENKIVLTLDGANSQGTSANCQVCASSLTS